MSFWQQPAQSVGPHWLSVMHAPFKHDCAGAHCTQTFPPVPQDVGSVPVLQTPRTQQPLQFWGLHAIVHTGVLFEVSHT
jgi:hypothetical protein